ncbi:MAG: DUF58 domain-containing protein [Verrucomicrobiota bacterium]
MFKRYLYFNYRAFSALKFWLRRRVTAAGWLVLGATLAAAALGVDTNVSLAYQTFTLLFFLMLASVFLALGPGGKNISVERILPRFGSVGEPLFYTILLRNNSGKTQRSLNLFEEMADPRPSFEEFSRAPEMDREERTVLDRAYRFDWWNRLSSRQTYARIEGQLLPDLPAGREQIFRAELMPLRRGVMRLTGVALASPDPFGLFRSLRRLPAAQSVLILPKRYSMPPFALPGAMKFQQGGVSMASSIGESEEFVALREYRPGDPLRRIHWKSFAKIGKPIVKEFQEEFFVRHALVLDTFSPQTNSEIFEEAVSVAASIAYGIRDEDSLLDLMFVGPQAFCFTSGRGVAHTEQMLEILASVQTCRDKDFSSLEHLVLEHSAQISGCICVFLEWDEPRKTFVQSLKAQNIPVSVFVVTSSKDSLALGPMADEPQHFHTLPLGKVAEELALL